MDFHANNLSAADLLSGDHLRIGLYVSGVENNCNVSSASCALYGSITGEDNKDWHVIWGIRRFTGKFKVWRGFDIDLIEELADRGKFTYTIVSMGGNTDANGTVHPVAKTDNFGESCGESICKALPWRTGQWSPCDTATICSTLSFTGFRCLEAS